MKNYILFQALLSCDDIQDMYKCLIFDIKEGRLTDMNYSNLNFQSYRTLSVLQFSTQTNGFDFISASYANKNNFINIEEINTSGSVNNIIVKNISDHFVFFSDGDILNGAKQNRVLNASVLLAPKSQTVIPVSCVESGRWNYRSPKFTSTDYSANDNMRAAKSKMVKTSLDRNMGYYADQGKIWDTVDFELSLKGVNSSTSNLSDGFDERRMDIDTFLRNFRHVPGSNGAAYFIYNKLVNIDIFGRKEIFEEYFYKLTRGAAFSAFSLKDKNVVIDKNIAENIIYKTDKHIGKLDINTHAGVGVGEEKRFDDDIVTGFELSYKENLIHKAVLNLTRI